jgi:hypothetical protein
MNLGKYIFGTREEYFDKMDDDTRKRQYLVYNILTLMFFVLVTMSFIAGLIYGLIIFNSWIISIFVGLFLGLQNFILRLVTCSLRFWFWRNSKFIDFFAGFTAGLASFSFV